MATGRKSIAEKFLDRNDLFGIEFKEGYVFLEVDEYSETDFEPFSNFGEVPAQDNLGYTIPDDPNNNNDEILYINEGRNKVIHCGIGHRPSFLRRYTKYPEGGTTMRQHPSIGSPTSANGDKFGYVGGDDSPYENPTDAEELIVPPGVSIAFDFYNPDPTESHKVKANIKYRVYKVNPINPNRHTDQIRRIMSPGSPMPVFSAGGMDAKVSYRLESDWGIGAMSNKQVQKIMGGK